MINHQTFAETRIGQRSGSLPGRDSKRVKRSGTDPNQSKAPKKHGRKTRKDIESTIVNIRKALMVGNEHESKYLGVGADAIQYRMERLVFRRMRYLLYQR